MKRLILIVLSAFFISSLFAYEFDDSNYYLVPLASSAINLRSLCYPDRSNLANGNTLKWSGHYFPSDDSYSTWEKAQANNWKYYDPNIVLTGGYSDDPVEDDIGLRNALEGGELSIYVESSTGALEMASLSNDAYRVPFKLFVIVKTSRHYQSRNSSDEKLIQVIEIDETFEESQYEKLSFAYDDNSNDGSAVFFDVILALPGRFEDNNDLSLTYNGKRYILSEKDDYVAMVTVHIQLRDKDGKTLGSGKAFTIPFSGYIEHQALKTPSKASLFIKPLPAASNLDLQNDVNLRISIAQLDFVANYGKETDQSKIPDSIYIFASSSSKPTLQGERFRFVNERIKDESGGLVSMRNSLGFNLYMKGKDEEYVEFDGTTYFSQADGVVGASVSPEVISGWNSEGAIKHSAGSYVTYFVLSTDIQISIDSPPSYLESGRYKEDVYIHVVSSEGT